MLRRIRAIAIAMAFAACAHPRHAVVLAFPHGGDAGAEGIRADAAASEALQARGYDVEHIDLDAGVQNPHQDEGTDDQRAAAYAATLPRLLANRRDVVGVIVGPTRRIADAVPWRALHVPIVAVAPLVRNIPCTCQNETQLRHNHAAIIVEAADGTRWMDSHGRTFTTLREAARDKATFDVVNRHGFAYRVPRRARATILATPDVLDRRDFSSAALGLVPVGRFAAPERLAVEAVDKLLRAANVSTLRVALRGHSAAAASRHRS